MDASEAAKTVLGARGIPADKEIDADTEDLLATLVLRAQTGDLAARDEIYGLLLPKVDRWVWRYWRIVRTADALIEQDDLAHEGYLILVDLIERWPGEAGFGAYVLSRFPWRLSDAAWSLAGRSTRRRGRADESDEDEGFRLMVGGRTLPPRATVGDKAGVEQVADARSGSDEAYVQLEALAGALGEPDGCILLWRIRDREAMTVIADRLGLTRRTVHRRWERIMDDLRQMLA